MIGGNCMALIQVKEGTQKNQIGERVPIWKDNSKLTGWLDLSGGDSTMTYNAKIQESTHIFMCDYQELSFTSENARMIIDGEEFEIQIIDDPMKLHQHLEFYLKYIGGGLNG